MGPACQHTTARRRDRFGPGSNELLFIREVRIGIGILLFIKSRKIVPILISVRQPARRGAGDAEHVRIMARRFYPLPMHTFA
jgi:hypothetical protein